MQAGAISLSKLTALTLTAEDVQAAHEGKRPAARRPRAKCFAPSARKARADLSSARSQ
jgi:hypothetical protein